MKWAMTVWFILIAFAAILLGGLLIDNGYEMGGVSSYVVALFSFVCAGVSTDRTFRS